MKIRIIRGMYGNRENGRIVEKNPDPPPFEVAEKEGQRLIGLGIAASAEARKAEEIEEPEEAEVMTGYLTREQLENMKLEELRILAESLGLKKNGSRTELIERIMEESVEIEEEEAPELSPADPE